jgi:hypothetical protein
MTPARNIPCVLLIALLLVCGCAKTMACIPQPATASDVACASLAVDFDSHAASTNAATDAALEDVSDADDFISCEPVLATAPEVGVALMGRGDLHVQRALAVHRPPPNAG